MVQRRVRASIWAGAIWLHVKAKNTLDVNYLFLAEKTKLAEIRPLHFVTKIEPQGTGYRVSFDRLENGSAFRARKTPASDCGRGVARFTELMLRCRDQHKTLPAISGFLAKTGAATATF